MGPRAQVGIRATDGLVLFIRLVLSLLDILIHFHFPLFGLLLRVLVPLFVVVLLLCPELVEVIEGGELADGVDELERKGLVLVGEGVVELGEVEEAVSDADRSGSLHISLRFDLIIIGDHEKFDL